MPKPRSPFAFGAGTSAAQNRGIRPVELRLHEEIAKDRVSRIRPRNRENYFGVTGQFDRSLSIGMVRKGHAPQLNVIIDGKADFRSDSEVALAPVKLCIGPRKNNFILFGLA